MNFLTQILAGLIAKPAQKALTWATSQLQGKAAAQAEAPVIEALGEEAASSLSQEAVQQVASQITPKTGH